MDRDDLGSWLSGPRAEDGLQAGSGYPGQRLGLPETGAGAVAGWGQRIGALVIDWLIALGITRVLLGAPGPGNEAFSLAVLAVFGIEYVLLLLIAGRTIGMTAARFRVKPVGSEQLSGLRIVLRTILLALVLPAVVYDRDRRGLHDKAGRTVAVRDA
jgi:uncharacterized RDD family membrane protein YckC